MSRLAIIFLIFVSGGFLGVLVMVFRKIPILVKLTRDESQAAKSGFREQLKIKLKAIKYSTYRPLVLSWLEKNLRKFRLLFLKIDNLFLGLINSFREKSQIWTIRSGAWGEYRRMKKKEKAQIFEQLDKVQISQELEKIKKEAAKEEDAAFKEKVKEKAEAISNGSKRDFEPVIETLEAEKSSATLSPIDQEEAAYIEQVAKNPKDVQAYRDLGFLYLRQKNYSDARACFRQVLKIEPDNKETKIKLDEIKGLRDKTVKIQNGN